MFVYSRKMFKENFSSLGSYFLGLDILIFSPSKQGYINRIRHKG